MAIAEAARFACGQEIGKPVDCFCHVIDNASHDLALRGDAGRRRRRDVRRRQIGERGLVGKEGEFLPGLWAGEGGLKAGESRRTQPLGEFESRELISELVIRLGAGGGYGSIEFRDSNPSGSEEGNGCDLQKKRYGQDSHFDLAARQCSTCGLPSDLPTIP